ncbi:MAG: transposase family protein [Gammaproteobacteria bacterium]|jgi:hypothetical protein|nr:transposase family protein [Gammaproteobacteria bacterium]
MTMINRSYPGSSVKRALTHAEIYLLDCLVKNKKSMALKDKNLLYYLTQIAKLGGYLGRATDLPLGNVMMWRGLSTLTDIQLGFNLALKIVGN